MCDDLLLARLIFGERPYTSVSGSSDPDVEAGVPACWSWFVRGSGRRPCLLVLVFAAQTRTGTEACRYVAMIELNPR